MINAKDVKPEIFWPKKNGEAGKKTPQPSSASTEDFLVKNDPNDGT